MKPLGETAAKIEAEAKAARHPKYPWSRHWNGFIDLAVWRLVASELDMPLYQVQAFVMRLDSFANQADERGSVAGFNPAEFGIALGMSTNDAARLFATLEREDIGWITWDHITDFYTRNP